MAKKHSLPRFLSGRRKSALVEESAPTIDQILSTVELTVDAITLRRMLDDLRPDFRQALW